MWRHVHQFLQGRSPVGFIHQAKVQFPWEKEGFDLKFGANYASFASISIDIKKVVDQIQSTGSMTILAYQNGGNPVELAKFFNSTCGTGYCAASCSMLKLTDCDNAITGLLKYAINVFPTQVKL
jgi:hypothetical protein